MAEARLEDGVPQTAGWFVLNARDAPWMHNDMRSVVKFGGEGEAHFDELGIGLYWIQPGQPMSMYHHEAGQEDFLVLRGACLIIVEGQERELRAWDLFHCPPHTPHTMVATGDEPALVLAVGARKERGSVFYPHDDAAVRHGAGVEVETGSPAEAYASFSEPVRGPAPEIFDRAP
jgi:quercetin dioxygenase-like cupin family protein